MHARSMCFTAVPGSADELARLLLLVADQLSSVPGCVYWLVARNPESEDEVWVQELWESEAAAKRALEGQDADSGPNPTDVLALCDGTPRRTDLTPLGGVGFTDR